MYYLMNAIYIDNTICRLCKLIYVGIIQNTLCIIQKKHVVLLKILQLRAPTTYNCVAHIKCQLQKANPKFKNFVFVKQTWIDFPRGLSSQLV